MKPAPCHPSRRYKARGLCGACYLRARRSPEFVSSVAHLSVAERFWSKVNQSPGQGPHGECWEWAGARGGYGYMTIRGRNVLAHREAWMLAHGVIPSSVHVLHECDNPPCVRLSHLFRGNHQINVADRDAKGRQSAGDAHWTRLHPEGVARGERCGCAKLDAPRVVEMRRIYAKGLITKKDLGHQFGVSDTVVGQIVRRERWTHVLEPAPAMAGPLGGKV